MSIAEKFNLEELLHFNEYVQTKKWNKVKELYFEYNVQYRVKDKEELKQIINDYIKFDGNECDLNWIDTSMIADMSKLFYNALLYRVDFSEVELDTSNMTIDEVINKIYS